MSNAQIQSLARRLSVLEKDRIQRKQPNLGFSTIDGGALQANDHDGALTMIIGTQYDGTNTAAVVTGPTPPTPTLPMVTAGSGSLRVYWDGTFEDGAVAPMDFARVLVYATPSLGYPGPDPLDQAQIVGGFTSATGGEITAALDPGTEYVVYLVTWSQAGKHSAASGADLGTPADAPVPTSPPAASPALTVVGMPDSFLLRTEPIDPTTVLTYQVSYDAGATWVDIAPTEARTTIMIAKSGETGGQFEVGHSYLFRVQASNAAPGALPAPSPTVSAQLDTSKVALVASQLISAQVLAGFALFGEVQVGGDSFTLAPPGLYPDDPERNKGGLWIELENGGLIHLPADGSPATITAHLTAESLNVVNGAELSGASHLGGQIEIGAGVNDPEDAPQVTTFYDSVAPYESVYDCRGLCRNIANSGWVFTSSQIAVYEMDDTTGLTTEVWNGSNLPADLTISKIYGVTKIGSYYYAAAVVWSGGYDSYLTFVQLDSSWDVVTYSFVESRYDFDPSVSIGITDGGDLLVAVEGSSNTVLRRYTVPDFTLGGIVTLGGITGLTTGCFRGTADFGSMRYVLQRNSHDVDLWDASITSQPGDSWPRPRGEAGRGIWWDGTNWWSMNSAGRVRKLESASVAPAATYWVSYAWVDSDTHTTGPSPQKSFTRPKRAKMQITATAAPQESVAVGHAPNRIQLYAATSSGGTKYPQGSPLAIGTRVGTLASVATSGTPAPANNWSGVTNPGVLEAEQGGFWVDGNSDGSVGNESLRDDIDSVPMARIERTTNQIMGNGATTDLTWTTVNYNRGMTTSGTGITIPKDGLYFIKCQVGIATNNAGGGIAHIAITGANHGTVILSRVKIPDAGGVTVLGGSDIIKCLAGDVITASVFHSNGSDRSLQLGDYETALAVKYEGPVPA